MALRSLNSLNALRELITGSRRLWFRLRYGVTFGRDVSVSMSCRLRPGARGSITVGDATLIAFKTLIYTRDPLTGEDRPIRIGRNCFIGGGSTILPGVTIGDGSIVGGGGVVFEDVPPRSIVGGNPARVLRTEIQAGRRGRLEGADDNSRRMWQ